jgi:hypothetical protein
VKVDRSALMPYSLRQITPESKFCHDLHVDIFDQILPVSLISEVLILTCLLL